MNNDYNMPEKVLERFLDHLQHSATREELSKVSSTLEANIQKLDSKIDSVRTELKAEMSEMRTELKAEMSEMRTELKAGTSEVRNDLQAQINKLDTKIDSHHESVKSEFKEMRSLYFKGVVIPIVLGIVGYMAVDILRAFGIIHH